MLGERDRALAYLDRALKIAPNDPTVRFKAALVHNQLKDDNQTLEWLERAAQAGYSITTIRDVPNFDHLWAYGRFQDLLRKY
jgi:tetratricopeptide (TPR) repeat protein